jgi:lipopolysaccharide/colanic/teichoic acid biosynthesis glycosyltransferase
MAKRIVDLFFGVALSLIMLVPLLLVAGLVFFLLGRPVIFIQTRAGFAGEPFKILKFRSMLPEFDSSGRLRPEEERLTSFGRFLRASSLDELPSLWNVVRGEMSLVGPRPLLIDYLPLYSSEQSRRHEVRPGITGWAQVNGRNALTWEEKFEFDVWYVDNRSLWLDIRILFMTVKKVFARDGISAQGEATMPRFLGSNRSEI